MTAPPAPIIVTATMAPADQAWADALRTAHFPPERNVLAAHITLFHAIPPSALDEVKGRLARLCADHRPPPAMIAGLRSLGRGVAVRVESPALLALRQELAGSLTGLLTAQDQARPALHITIQNKVTPDVARATLAALEPAITPRPLTINGLACHYYRGGPWEAIAGWSFRGR